MINFVFIHIQSFSYAAQSCTRDSYTLNNVRNQGTRSTKHQRIENATDPGTLYRIWTSECGPRRLGNVKGRDTLTTPYTSKTKEPIETQEPHRFRDLIGTKTSNKPMLFKEGRTRREVVTGRYF